MQFILERGLKLISTLQFNWELSIFHGLFIIYYFDKFTDLIVSWGFFASYWNINKYTYLSNFNYIIERHQFISDGGSSDL